MSVFTIDFETYYDRDYSLSKLTTEEYVRDPRFEIILCGIKRDDAPAYWISGERVVSHLQELELEQHAVLAHHAHFDGLILSHHCNIRPRIWFDTLSMARGVFGKGKLSLAKLAERFGIGVKGDEVLNALGMRRAQFSPDGLARYGRYCCNDCDLEYALFNRLLPSYQRSELKLIDGFIRMFTEPVLELDALELVAYAEDIRINKAMRLLEAGVQLADVMSAEKFAECLRFLGVEPPRKRNKKGDWAYAFAKTDEAMQELAEHEDPNVQALIAARLQNKTTIAETRARRMADMAERGRACVYLNYYGAAQTGRGSGGDKMNWQNFTRGSPLRKAINAPAGHELVVGDSSNIESRMLDWLAMQEDAVEAYRRYDRGEGPDIYCVMAEKIYGRVITKKNDPDERQMGKVTKLGLGFGMGDEKFIFAVKAQAKKTITPEQSSRIVTVYRTSHSQVVKFWRRCDEALRRIYQGEIGVKVDARGVITTCEGGLLLPNGMVIRYPDLEYSEGAFTYFNGKTREYIYGAKVCENIVQALARIIVMEQCLMVGHRPWVLSVHDEGVWCAPTDEVDALVERASEALRTPLPWCPDLPLNCEVKHNRSYGLAK